MVGRKSDPVLGTADAQCADFPHLPPYSDADTHQSSDSRAFLTETTMTTVTTTTQTTTFFSLPLWRRRAGPPMTASAVSEGLPSPGKQIGATEDGRITRASSYNLDVNKRLPEVPHTEGEIDPLFSRRSTGSAYFPDKSLEADRCMKTTRPSRSSTLMPPQPQSTRTLAQAGLGIGLPHVMPLAAGAAPGGSRASAPRPSTAPRPTRPEPSQEVRRVRSFSRIQGEPATSHIDDGRQGQRVRKMSSTLLVPNGNGASHEPINGASKSSDVRPEPKSLIRRASFWNRRRVQSLKGPSEAQTTLNQDKDLSPVPALPTFQPVSPMFPERPTQSSPAPTPQSATFQSPGNLRRRHSERSTSTHHSSPRDPSFSSDRPPIPARSPHRPRPPRNSSRPRTATLASATSSFLEPRPSPVHMSFISTPAISRFPIIDDRQARPRSMTNPPSVLHRLSMGFFNSTSPSSPISSPTVSTSTTDDIPVTSSPRHSATLPRSSLSKLAVEIPKPRADEESPGVFLGRLEEAVSKAEIANVLAGSGDPYYTQALQLYIDRFNFTNDPLDIALRKLLMEMGLPKETQQIDRVMEAFAASYTKYNPNLFVSKDHPYVLAFSLIMLHTDAFNKSNKRKMTKADYIKNTKLVGVSTEVLDYFFDNIVFAPFIFIEDPVDVNGQRGFTQDGKMMSGSGQVTPTMNGSGLLLGKSNKVDAYYLITRNLLDSLRVDVETYIPLRNPYSYQGTAGSWNEAELRRSFARADVIQVDTTDARRMSALPFFSINVGPGPISGTFPSSALFDQDGSLLSGFSSLKVTKVGLLNRKDDLLDGGKRASSRKWREWSIVLTGSQLLFYRDSALALNLIVQAESPQSEAFPPPTSFLRPDELLSVKDAVAVHDSSYVKRDYVVRIVMPTGRQLLLQTENEIQRNEWIAHINYASAFKTAGIRMRPVGASEDARMDGSSYTQGAPLIPSESTPSSSSMLSENLACGVSYTIPDIFSDDLGLIPRTESPSANESTNNQSRSRIVLNKIREFESRIETAQSQLDSDIRFVHNLAILTPFQRSTRDRLQMSVINIGRQIKQLRLEIVKATCFRDVLAADLASEERERRYRRKGSSASGVSQHREKNSPIPTMILSVHDDDVAEERASRPLSRSDLSDLSHGQPDSSICESFHSALDFGSDWPRSVRASANDQRDIVPTQSSTSNPGSPLETPSREALPGDSSESSFFPPSSSTEPPSGRASTSSLSVATDISPVTKQRISEEQAEDWDKTRAARRVSLVRVPAGLKTSIMDERRRSSQTTGKVSEETQEHNDISVRFNGHRHE